MPSSPAAAAPSSREAVRFAPPYELPHWPFVDPPERAAGTSLRHPIVIAGGGLAGLTLACDLASRGIPSLLLDEDDTVGVRGASSRGICYAQRSLEIFARLGFFPRIAERGITWSSGRTFSGEEEVWRFELQTDSHSAQPPFINLQQFYIEWFLVDRLLALGKTDLRWKHRITGIEPGEDATRLTVETPAGSYTLEAEWLIDATGAHSPIRESLGLDHHPSRSTDRWCISDVRFETPLPIERWTWVDAPFNQGRAVWQHLMGDGVWRMDYQMPADADPAEVSRPEVVSTRLREQLGEDTAFEFVWIGPYGYRDHLMERFRHGRILFIGDAAHVVSPFGARGGNSGIQDAANLAWKLALVRQGKAGEALLDSYDDERRAAAVQNLQVTRRTARFLAPRSPAEHLLRRAVLSLARRYPFARTMVNTGRMSVPNAYPPSAWAADGARPVQNIRLRRDDGGCVELADLLREGTAFAGIWFAPDAEALRGLQAADLPVPLHLLVVAAGTASAGVTVIEADEALRRQLGDPAPGSFCLVRPDAYLAATVPAATAEGILQALEAALGLATAD